MNSRKKSVINRLKKRLKEKSESLADQFDFCVYIAFVLKSPKKVILYRSTEVIALMNNKFEQNIKAAKEPNEVHQHLLEDIVQLHISTFSNVKQGHFCPPTDVNFLIWPRSDLDHVTCVLLSRWKNDEADTFRCIQQKFCLTNDNLQNQITPHLTEKNTGSDIMISSSNQRLFLLLEKLMLNKRKKPCFKTKRLCLFVPQSLLTSWTASTEQEVLDSFDVWTEALRKSNNKYCYWSCRRKYIFTDTSVYISLLVCQMHWSWHENTVQFTAKSLSFPEKKKNTQTM